MQIAEIKSQRRRAYIKGQAKRAAARVKVQPLPKECCQCRVNYGRTLDIAPEEAILVVYLASLDEETRKQVVVMNEAGTANGMTLAQTQLLAEAELVRFAIDMCDSPGAAGSGDASDQMMC